MTSNQQYNYSYNSGSDRSGQLDNYAQFQYSNTGQSQPYTFSQAYGYPATNQQGTNNRLSAGDGLQTENQAAAVALSSLGGRGYNNVQDRQDTQQNNQSNRTNSSWFGNDIANDTYSYNSARRSQLDTAAALPTSQQQSVQASANLRFYDQTRYSDTASTLSAADQGVSQTARTSSPANWSQAGTSYANNGQTQQFQHQQVNNRYESNQSTQQNPRQHDRTQSLISNQQLRQGRTATSPQQTHAQNFRQEDTSRLPPISSSDQYGSAETSSLPLTVDPAQVYDYRAEQQRKASVEAERKRKQDVEKARLEKEIQRQQSTLPTAVASATTTAATSSGSNLSQPGPKKTAKPSSSSMITSPSISNMVSQSSSSAANGAMTAAGSKPPQKRGPRGPRKSKEAEKSQSTSDAQGTGGQSVNEEAEMRAMFLKMREFNARNPEMLAKLWQEEREVHVAGGTNSPAVPSTSLAVPSPTQTTDLRPFKGGSKAKNGKAPTKDIPTPTPTAQITKTKTETAKAGPPPSIPSLQPPAPASQGREQPTLWPTHKRTAIAELAKKWLLALPSNTGRTLYTVSIEKLLDSNPTYAQLCEYFEKQGFSFERSAFARHLLQAMPAPWANVPKHPVPQPATAEAVISHTLSTPEEPNRRGSNKGNRSNAQTKLPESVITPAAAGLTGSVSGQTAPTQPVVEQLGSVIAAVAGERSFPALEDNHKPPADKEEAARKRTFGDLVDLTADLDSDDDIAPKRLKNLNQHPASHPIKLELVAPAVNSAQPPANPLQPQATSAQVATFSLPNLPVFQTPKPQAAPAPVPKQNPQLHRQQVERMRGQMLVEPIMRDRVARKSRYDSQTIARDVLLATGRHPDMRPLNSHLLVMEKLLGLQGGSYNSDGSHGNRSDLATIKWQIIDPDPPKSDLPEKKGDDLKLNMDDEADADDELGRQDSSRFVRNRTEGSTGTPASFDNMGKKRRGRPRIHHSSFASDHKVQHDNTNNIDTSSHVKKKGGRPRKSDADASAMPSSASGTPVGYAAFRQMDQNGQPIKKLGRPVGWRKAIHSKAAQQQQEVGTAVRDSSLRTVSRVVPVVQKLQEPHYQVYKCRWLGCASELHNLDGLKRHLVKLHCKATEDGHWKCLWFGCLGRNEKGRIEVTPANAKVFDTLEAWVKHVDDAHIQKIAWRLGDGPRGGQADRYQDTESEAYLSDAYGRSVTPVIQPLSGLPTKTPNKPHMTREQQKADKEFDVFRNHKKAIGITIDRLGCILPNEKRRLGFMDDEDFEEIIEESDPDD